MQRFLTPFMTLVERFTPTSNIGANTALVPTVMALHTRKHYPLNQNKMSAHEKALAKKKGKTKKLENEVDEEGKELNEKGKKPKREVGAKNNDSQED